MNGTGQMSFLDKERGGQQVCWHSEAGGRSFRLDIQAEAIAKKCSGVDDWQLCVVECE